MSDKHPELVVRCACGWEARGPVDQVVEVTQAHGRDVHNMVASREEVLAMATTVPAVSDPAGPAQ